MLGGNVRGGLEFWAAGAARDEDVAMTPDRAPDDTLQQDDAPPVASRDDEVKAAEAERGESAVVGRTVTINRPREEVYAFWRDFPNLAAHHGEYRADRRRSTPGARTGW